MITIEDDTEAYMELLNAIILQAFNDYYLIYKGCKVPASVNIDEIKRFLYNIGIKEPEKWLNLYVKKKELEK